MIRLLHNHFAFFGGTNNNLACCKSLLNNCTKHRKLALSDEQQNLTVGDLRYLTRDSDPAHSTRWIWPNPDTYQRRATLPKCFASHLFYSPTCFAILDFAIIYYAFLMIKFLKSLFIFYLN